MTSEKTAAAFMSSMAEPRKKCEVKPVYKTWTRHSLLGISGLPSRTNLLHFAVSRKLFHAVSLFGGGLLRPQNVVKRQNPH